MPKGIPKNGINKGWFRKGVAGPWLGVSPERSPNWKGGPVKKNCIICGAKFETRRIDAPKIRFCSRRCFGISRKGKIGDQSNSWKGENCKTILSERIRETFRYKLWRKTIFERDKYICVICHEVGGILNAHHIKSFSKILRKNKIKTIKMAMLCGELFEINNGVTLCKTCHKLKHNHKF